MNTAKIREVLESWLRDRIEHNLLTSSNPEVEEHGRYRCDGAYNELKLVACKLSALGLISDQFHT